MLTLNKKLEILRKKLSILKTSDEIEEILVLVEKILILKEEKNAVILGHNYMVPEVFYGVSDYSGDSLGLAKYAKETDADIILFNGVLFMAETAKILNPEKKVLIADKNAGCSLADSITREDVIAFKKKYPNIPVVTYINCSAEVKAESDVICTSANAVKIVESIDSDEVLFLPDKYLAENVQKHVSKKIYSWDGKCMVHELFTVVDVNVLRKQYNDIFILAHPECKSDVTDLVDYTGSTTQMGTYLKGLLPNSDVMLMTECSMGDNLQIEFPDLNFVSSCQSCPHMKKITLQKVLNSLKTETDEVLLDEDVMLKAKHSLDRMLEYI